MLVEKHKELEKKLYPLRIDKRTVIYVTKDKLTPEYVEMSRKKLLHQEDDLNRRKGGNSTISLDVDRLKQMVDEGMKIRDIARNMGVSEWDDGCDAIVDCVYDKQRNLEGVLIRFENRKAMNVGNISHESSHIAMEIFKYIGAEVDLSNQEPYSYLVGWIADCINQVKTGKFKD